jgi:hypothetical protein
MKPEIRAAADKELSPDTHLRVQPASRRRDEYIITSSAFEGQRGCFARDQSGAVVGVDLAGRLLNRLPMAPTISQTTRA